MTEQAIDKTGSQEREFLGHPIGLTVCFLTEMWERFSYYGMRALLILFLTKHFLFSAGEASLIYGAYTGLVYMLPVLGGYLADKYLGSRKAVTYGALLLVLGHLSLAFEGPQAVLNGDMVERSEMHVSIFFLSLALIITGVGFLKANISTIVGALYGPNDPRRDGGFSIFYMGINLGSLLATFFVAGIGEIYGWGYGFGLAGIGMLLGLLVFWKYQHLLEGRADPPDPEALKKPVFAGLSTEVIIYLGGVVAVLVMWWLVQNQKMVGSLLGASGVLMVMVVMVYGFTKCTQIERERLIVATILIVFQTVFWALFEQQGSSLTLLADQQFNRDLGLLEVTAAQVQTMNPLFIVILAPLFAWFWLKLSQKGLEPSTPAKFGIAMCLVGIGYILFSYGLGLTDGPGKSFFWLFVIYLFMTMAELCLSPVGLSMITKLSVARLVGMMMGMWFLFTAFANFVAGFLSSLTGTSSHGANSAQLDVGATIDLFNSIGMVAIGIGIILFILTPMMKKWMHGVH
ncbi:peptide MFS transporter [Temperatibacter marinus]|uniref:Peptide MFS transporter n=1 Tax=Temperatibacter marinus TaxID=1456591 RepID=A0AA52ECZ2_9PROT|nr:peptide MFS transporter [Temperatibacter marinus]WND01423.1 peptide MFS transporter [Temperatibacter marinus]